MSAQAFHSPRLDLVSPNALFIGGLVGTAGLAVFAFLAPSVAAWGSLVGFVFWSSFPIGSIALSLIHRTTGGRWGVAAAPTLSIGVLCALFLPVGFALLLSGLHLLYHWANEVDGTAPDVARLYLNVPAFIARGFIATLAWAAIGLLIARGRLSLLGASIALCFTASRSAWVAID